MPKKIDPQVRERAVRLVLDHRAEYPSNKQAVAAVARQEDPASLIRPSAGGAMVLHTTPLSPGAARWASTSAPSALGVEAKNRF